jgi:hypothetical protein
MNIQVNEHYPVPDQLHARNLGTRPPAVCVPSMPLSFQVSNGYEKPHNVPFLHLELKDSHRLIKINDTQKT